jgi:hypothetical protein
MTNAAFLIGEPAQRSQGNTAIVADRDDSLNAVSHARKTAVESIGTNTIIEDQMAALDTYAHTVPKQRHDTVARLDDRWAVICSCLVWTFAADLRTAAGCATVL